MLAEDVGTASVDARFKTVVDEATLREGPLVARKRRVNVRRCTGNNLALNSFGCPVPLF